MILPMSIYNSDGSTPAPKGWAGTPETNTPAGVIQTVSRSSSFGSEIARTPPMSYITGPTIQRTWAQQDPDQRFTPPAPRTPQMTPRDFAARELVPQSEFMQRTTDLVQRDMVQQHAWTAGKRSITPPPSIVPPSVITENLAPGQANEEWVSISTANMSPFTILRIKALIELSSIPDDYPYSVYTRCNQEESNASRLRSRMNTPVSADGENGVSSQWWVSQLNELIMQSNGLNRKEALTRMNMQLAAEKLQLGIGDDNIGLQSPCRLTFNPGAALICFDPHEKPRRIKENHRKHFHHFLQMQQQQER